MERKALWFIFGLIGFVIIMGLLFYLSENVSGSPGVGLEECNSLEYNGGGLIDIVFFSSKGEAREYMDELFSFEPFGANKEKFNVHYIDDYFPECELYKEKAFYCYSRELIKKAGSCENDYIVVVGDQPRGIRASTYMNVLSLNKNLPLSVFPHEFAHAFANLADEYVPAKIPRGSKNCASECNDFSVSEGCYEGCSESSYKRSVENGLMKSLSSEGYGVFNEVLISQKIDSSGRSLFSGFAVQEGTDCKDERYYLVEGHYDGSIFEVIDQRLEVGCVGGSGSGDFEFDILNSQGESLGNEDFNPELIFIEGVSENGDIEGDHEVNTGDILLKVPVIDGGESLEVSRSGERISSFELGDEKQGARACRLF